MTFARLALCSVQYRRDRPGLASMKTRSHAAMEQMPSRDRPNCETVRARPMTAPAAYWSAADPAWARWTCQRWSS